MVETKTLGSTLYLGLSGELDESVAPFVRKRLDDAIDAASIKKVIFELGELKFMDSTGIGVLLGRYKRLVARGIPAYLANAGTAIDKILVLSGLYGIMPKMEFKEA